jgi:hypothetical protein
MTNPYLQKKEKTRVVMTKLGVEDWNLFYLRSPLHGTQDKLLSTLFAKFTSLVKDELTSRPTADPITERDRIAGLIARLTIN